MISIEPISNPSGSRGSDNIIKQQPRASSARPIGRDNNNINILNRQPPISSNNLINNNRMPMSSNNSSNNKSNNNSKINSSGVTKQPSREITPAREFISPMNKQPPIALNYNYNDIKRQPVIETRSKSPGIAIPQRAAYDYRSTPVKPSIANSRPMSTKAAAVPNRIMPGIQVMDQPDKILVNPIKVGGGRIPGSYQNNNFLKANSRPATDHGVIKVMSNEKKLLNIYRK
jgi:hypothetical protein